MAEILQLPPSPWHPGEVALQRRTGAEARMAEIGRHVIRDHLIDQHRNFYPLLDMVVLGTVDGAGRPWATIRSGRPGFLRSPDPWTLVMDLDGNPADPAEEGLGNGNAVGLLGIDLTTRRRNRLNGTVRRGPEGLALAVSESFGNCPKYIQTRPAYHVNASPGLPVVSAGLSDAAIALIRQADTFFVASSSVGEDGRKVDVSHRGGLPGFVRVEADGWLTIPDLPGNRFFSTLGNIVATGTAGLVFVDFATGSLLQMTGQAEVLEEGPGDYPGAERLWRFRPALTVFRPGAIDLRHGRPGVSPFLEGTGWRRD